MESAEKEAFRENSVESVLTELARHGLLLKQDKSLPNVVSIVTGESLRTSWWSHPKSHLIFSVLSSLADDPRVLITKLLDRKDTFIHSSLWPAFIAVACAREEWQCKGLSSSAADLLNRIDGGDEARRTPRGTSVAGTLGATAVNSIFSGARRSADHRAGWRQTDHASNE
jgi:hypothetical protein